jgi:hypothetical protein
MTLVDGHAAAQAADAMQAAYFRRSLCDERVELCAEIAKRREDIGRRVPHSTHRLGTRLRSAEAQLRYLDRLIARLDQRFGAHLSRHD